MKTWATSALRSLTLGAMLAGVVVGMRFAHGYCLQYEDVWPRSTYSSIPVYIHEDVPSHLRHVDGTSWTMSQFQAEIMHLLQKINDYNGAAIPPLRLAGVTDSELQEAHTIKIILKEDGVCGFNATCEGPPGGPHNGCLLRMPRYTCTANDDKYFEPFDPNYPIVDNTSTLLHEFGHLLGLKHPDDCPPAPACDTVLCSVMGHNSGLQEPSSFFNDDSNGFRIHYGNHDGVREHYERYTSSWYLLTDSSVPSHMPIPGVSDMGSGSSYMAFTRRTTDGHSASFYRWVSTTRTWSYWGYLASNGIAATGAAIDASGKGYFMFQADEDASYTNKALNWTSLTGYSAGPPRYVGNTDTVTRRHGTDVAYDPRYGKLVAVTRAIYVPGATAHWQVRLHLIDPSSNSVLRSYTLVHSGGGVLAGDTPSVTCGPSSLTYNCMIVWEEAAQPGNDLDTKYHVIRSAQFYFLNYWGNWELHVADPVFVGPNPTTAYIAYGRPDVAYKGPTTSSSAFEVAWTVPAYGSARTYTYTMSKSASPTAAWSTLRVLPYDASHRTSAVVGAGGGWAELIRMYKP